MAGNSRLIAIICNFTIRQPVFDIVVIILFNDLRMNMRDVTLTHYYVDNLELIVDVGSYLVEIRFLPDMPRGCHSVSDLPEWVFQSKLAIWLMDRGSSIMERAMKGDQIKKRLMMNPHHRLT